MRIYSKVFRMACLGSPIVLLLSALALAQPSTEDKLMDHLRYLASDELKGRGNGTPELAQAAHYIAELFREYDLQPAGNEKTYFQEFDVSMGRSLGPDNQVTLATGSEQIRLEVLRDYVPLTSGPDTVVQGPLVFAGFGISAPELEYDDYRDLDVSGKIVLIFEHEPQEQAEESRFAGRELTPYATVLRKVMNAKKRGAVGVILLSNGFNHRPVRSPVPVDLEWRAWESTRSDSIQNGVSACLRKAADTLLKSSRKSTVISLLSPSISASLPLFRWMLSRFNTR